MGNKKEGIRMEAITVNKSNFRIKFLVNPNTLRNHPQIQKFLSQNLLK